MRDPDAEIIEVQCPPYLRNQYWATILSSVDSAYYPGVLSGMHKILTTFPTMAQMPGSKREIGRIRGVQRGYVACHVYP